MRKRGIALIRFTTSTWFYVTTTIIEESINADVNHCIYQVKLNICYVVRLGEIYRST